MAERRPYGPDEGEDRDIPPGRSPSRLDEVLGRVMRRLRVSDSASATTLFSRWRSIVGDTIADHATPKRLDKRRLVVEVDDPMWATQLRFLEPRVLSTLREHIGDEVESLDIRVRRS